MLDKERSLVPTRSAEVADGTYPEGDWVGRTHDTTMAVRLSNKMLDELRDAFGNYAEGDQIFLRDIGPVVRCVEGLKPAEAEIREMMVEAEKNEASTKTLFGSMIDLQMLVKLLSQYVTHPDPDKPDDLCVIFKPFDKEGRGIMSCNDFRHVMCNVGEKMTEEEVNDLVKMTNSGEHGDRLNYVKLLRAIAQ